MNLFTLQTLNNKETLITSKYLKTLLNMKKHIKLFLTLAITIFCAYSIQTKSDIEQQPTLLDYNKGKKWVWEYKGITAKGEIYTKS